MPSNHEKIPVLLVDDRPENLISLEALLDDMGLDLVRAHSGNEALRLTLHREFALVLLDVQMPEMDGFETAELMRQNPRTRQLPIIFVTAGMKEERHLFQGYQAGAVDYMMKPIAPALIRSKVRVFCDLYSQRRQLERYQEELTRQNVRLREANEQLERETERRLQAMEELQQKDRLMLQQSRMAAMGEMLDNIAHQWRQPLNIVALRVQEIGLCCELGDCSLERVQTSIARAMEVIMHLSQTIDDFRNLNSPDLEKSNFSVAQVLGTTLSVVQDSFAAVGVAIAQETSGDPRIEGYPNFFGQVLLNLLMNARDACLEREVVMAQISLRCWDEEGSTVVTITDNAGGIPKEIMGRIFDAYFTTKPQGKGTGIGLFMSKNIIESRMGGTLSVRNVAQGAEFRIEVPHAAAT